MYIEPEAHQLRALMSGAASGPIVMLNLLKYKPEGGEASYQAYGRAVLPLVAKVGGSVLWQGHGNDVVIGPDTDAWDSVVLVQYPSRQAFIEMVTSTDYQAIGHLRAEALADSRLIACTEVFRTK